MTSQQPRTATTIRLPDTIRARLDAYRVERGLSLNAAVTLAVSQMLDIRLRGAEIGD